MADYQYEAEDPSGWCGAYQTWLETSTLIESTRNLSRNVAAACHYIDWCRSNDVDVLSPSVAEVSRWIKRPRPDGRPSADSTRHVRRYQLIQFYDWLMTERPKLMVFDNPARKVKTRTPYTARPVLPVRLLTAEESSAFLEAAQGWTRSPHWARNRVAAGLLVHHGLRPVEIRSARLRGYRAPRGGQAATLETCIARSVPQRRVLHPQVAEWVEFYVSRVRPGPDPWSEDWLLLSSNGSQLYENAILWMVKKLAEQAGLERPWEVSPYAFRRTLINDARRLGLGVGTASLLAGHQRESTTVKYLQRITEPVDGSALWAARAAELGS